MPPPPKQYAPPRATVAMRREWRALTSRRCSQLLRCTYAAHRLSSASVPLPFILRLGFSACLPLDIADGIASAALSASCTPAATCQRSLTVSRFSSNRVAGIVALVAAGHISTAEAVRVSAPAPSGLETPSRQFVQSHFCVGKPEIDQIKILVHVDRFSHVSIETST